MYSASCSEWDA